MSCRIRRSCSSGFTIVELMVVISIISVLLAILLPALGKSRLAVGGVKCLSNLRQVGIGRSMYSHDFRDHFPITTWRASPIFLAYVGITNNTSQGVDTVLTCPVIQSSSFKTHYYYNNTYSMNSHTSYNSTFVRVQYVSRPTQVYNFGDGVVDQTMTVFGTFWFKNNISQYTTPRAAPAANKWDKLTYPHNDTNAMLYVDGHARFVTFDEVYIASPSSSNGLNWNK